MRWKQHINSNHSPLGDALAAEEVLARQEQRVFHAVVADGAVGRPRLRHLLWGGKFPSILSHASPTYMIEAVEEGKDRSEAKYGIICVHVQYPDKKKQLLISD